MGVVTGIVQEFQFGMNWSEYSRFVGDIFGAPLAIEGLLAFFLESTFLGLWIFGWDRLPKRLHLACIWLVAIGTILSAYFILAANSLDAAPGRVRRSTPPRRPRRTDGLLRGADQPHRRGRVPAHDHRVRSSPPAMFVLGISAWHLAPAARTSSVVPRRRCGWAW